MFCCSNITYVQLILIELYGLTPKLTYCAQNAFILGFNTALLETNIRTVDFAEKGSIIKIKGFVVTKITFAGF